jgi:poly-gamma-glutamate capsule biosynthesis protein CapA/YwtB (metallophosphatase superfamily)
MLGEAADKQQEDVRPQRDWQRAHIPQSAVAEYRDGVSWGVLRQVTTALAATCLAVVAACSQPVGVASAAVVRVQSFTVVATGDVLLHQKSPLIKGAAEAGQARGTGYDFSGVFADIAPVIQAADLAICHLETPLAESDGPFRGYPSFSVQPQIVDALTAAGYDTCSTASNHSLDAGFDGLVRTVNALNARHIGHTGTFRSEAESLTPHIVALPDVRIAQLSWTFGLNGIPEPNGKEWAVNDFDPIRPQVDEILADAARARQAGADIVIVSVHCCTEYNHTPDAAQVAVAAALLASPDIDLMIGHHAHVVQPFERVNGKWVAYGLGNHVAQQHGEAQNDSVIARFTFTRVPDRGFVITLAEAIPTRIQRSVDGVTVVLTEPGTRSFERVAQALDRRRAVDSGLIIRRAY